MLNDVKLTSLDAFENAVKRTINELKSNQELSQTILTNVIEIVSFYGDNEDILYACDEDVKTIIKLVVPKIEANTFDMDLLLSLFKEYSNSFSKEILIGNFAIYILSKDSLEQYQRFEKLFSIINYAVYVSSLYATWVELSPETFMSVAASYNSNNIIEYFIKEEYPMYNDSIYSTPLFNYVDARMQYDIFVKMIDAGANINECPEDGYSCLARACEAGRVDAVRLLVEKGASIYCCCKFDDSSALDFCSTKETRDYIKGKIDELDYSKNDGRYDDLY